MFPVPDDAATPPHQSLTGGEAAGAAAGDKSGRAAGTGNVISQGAGTASSAGGSQSLDTPPSLAVRYPWAVFIVPYALYLALTALEPTPAGTSGWFGWTIPYAAYPIVYTVKLLVVMACMALLWQGYRQFPFKLSPLAIGVGAVGVVLWVGLCKLALERAIFTALGLEGVLGAGERSAFNPLEHYADRPLLACGFLAVRFWGLAAIVPVIEEFFLRGFAMRYFLQFDWWNAPFGKLTPAALAVGTLVPVLSHPLSEMLAVLVWFSLVTWLMWRTRNIWDCVVAHMVTNFLLGVWVVASGDWQLM
ncbi:MAG: CAAX prenyl protease-related protein [Pirellulales bacterium]